MTAACRQGKVEQVYIKSNCGHSILLDTWYFVWGRWRTFFMLWKKKITQKIGYLESWIAETRSECTIWPHLPQSFSGPFKQPPDPWSKRCRDLLKEQPAPFNICLLSNFSKLLKFLSKALNVCVCYICRLDFLHYFSSSTSGFWSMIQSK